MSDFSLYCGNPQPEVQMPESNNVKVETVQPLDIEVPDHPFNAALGFQQQLEDDASNEDQMEVSKAGFEETWDRTYKRAKSIEDQLPDELLDSPQKQGAQGMIDELESSNNGGQPTPMPLVQALNSLKENESGNVIQQVDESFIEPASSDEMKTIIYQDTMLKWIQAPSKPEVLFQLDPQFVPSQYVFEHNGAKPYVEIKVAKTVQLQMTSEPVEYMWVFVGLYHSHPNYAKFPICKQSQDETLNTPFEIRELKSDLSIPLQVQVEGNNVKINGSLILLTQENCINLDYIVNSTDANNFGQKKEGKEWQQLVVPLTFKRAMEIINDEKHELSSEDMLYHSIRRVQVRQEMRRTAPNKPARSVEISFHLPASLKRKRLENEIVNHQTKRLRRELGQMNNQDIEAKAKSLGLEFI